MTTLAEITLMIAECLIAPRYGTIGVAQGNTSFEDWNLDEPDALFDGGTIWFLSGNRAGQFTTVTSWDQPTRTFTFPYNATLPGVGTYAVIDARYPLDQLIAAYNAAMQELGPFDAYADSMTVVADQVHYPLTVGIQGIKRVQIATSDTEPYTWTSPHRWWREMGSELIFSEQHLPPAVYAGNKIRLYYEAPALRLGLNNPTVAIPKDVHPQRIAWHAAWYAARWRNSRGDTTDAVTRGVEEAAKAQAFAMQLKHPVHRMEKDAMWSDVP